jgi:hypothetical protein
MNCLWDRLSVHGLALLFKLVSTGLTFRIGWRCSMKQKYTVLKNSWESVQQSIQYTQSGNCWFLAYIPSWWKNQPRLVGRGGVVYAHPLSLYYHHVQSCRADKLPLFHLYPICTLLSLQSCTAVIKPSPGPVKIVMYRNRKELILPAAPETISSLLPSELSAQWAMQCSLCPHDRSPWRRSCRVYDFLTPFFSSRGSS